MDIKNRAALMARPCSLMGQSIKQLKFDFQPFTRKTIAHSLLIFARLLPNSVYS